MTMAHNPASSGPVTLPTSPCSSLFLEHCTLATDTSCLLSNKVCPFPLTYQYVRLPMPILIICCVYIAGLSYDVFSSRGLP